MLTIRAFRNEDPPKMLELWRKTQQCQNGLAPLLSMSLNLLQTQVLGQPMLDNRSVMLAFDDDTPVGYVHTTFAPTEDGYALDKTNGQICFLCVDPDYSDASGAAAALIHAGETYLAELGAQKIYGGSPSLSVPFYTGFYSGGEAVGILLSDQTVTDAFLEANYQIHQKTIWFCFDLRNYAPAASLDTVSYHTELMFDIRETPEARTWWEGCIQAHGIWFDVIAFLADTNRPVARLRTRIAYPDTENFLSFTMYGCTWLASLIELRTHPVLADQGIQKFLLEEVIRYLVAHNQVARIEVHTAEESPLCALLRSQSWFERGSGAVFVKDVS